MTTNLPPADTAMNYLKVKWLHCLPDEPILLYCELDENRWELRKLEVYVDGRIGYSSDTESTDSMRLSLEPIPSLAEIASDPEFQPEEITR